MSKLFDLTGRTILVTGASRGIGFAMAQTMAEHGANVVLNARDPDALEAKADSRLRQMGGEGRNPLGMMAYFKCRFPFTVQDIHRLYFNTMSSGILHQL